MLTTLALVATLFALWLVWWLLVARHPPASFPRGLPSFPVYPVLGSALSRGADPLADELREQALFPGYVPHRMRVVDDFVVVREPRAVVHLLKTGVGHRDNRFNDLEGELFGAFVGSLPSRSPAYAVHRAAMSSSFTRDQLSMVAPFIAERAVQVAERWVASTSPPLLDDDLSRLTFDVICQALLGSHFDCTANSEYAQLTQTALDGLAREIMFRGMMWWLPVWPFASRREAYSAGRRVRALVEQRIDAIAAQGDDAPSCVCSRVLNSSKLDREQFKSEVLGSLFAGRDTTAHTVALALGHLAQPENAALRQRLCDEVAREWDHVGADWAELTSRETINRLRFTTSVMRETLRLYPIAASVMRRPTADVTIAGYRIPAETPCILSLQSVGICREVWGDDALEWKPQRWDNMPEANLSFWIPFAAGTHSCLGRELAEMEGRILLAVLVPRLEMSFVPGYKFGIEAFPLTRPKGGLPMIVRRRSSSSVASLSSASSASAVAPVSS